VPAGVDALVLLAVEELAVNELREGFHHWVRTICVPVAKGAMRKPLSHQIGQQLGKEVERGPVTDVPRAREVWDEVARDCRDLLRDHGAELEKRLVESLEIEYGDAVKREEARFHSRQGELSTLILEQSLAKLESEILELEIKRKQGQLFDEDLLFADLVSSQRAKEDELERRRAHYELLRQQLSRERVRVMEHLLPKRYALRGHVQVFPVAVEIRFPRKSAR
jgi:hypothetical protein